MKKLSVLIGMFFTLFLVLPLYAQLYVGVFGGVNFANFDVDPDHGFDWKTRTVFGAGGAVNYGATDFLTLCFEPMYLQKGSQIEEGENKAENKFDFIEIPVMLKYVFNTKNLKPYLMAGPTLGFLLSSKVKTTTGTQTEEKNIQENTKSTDFGLGFGAGVSIPMSNNSIFLEARYALGLTNGNDNPEDPDTVYKTKGIQIFAGITFPISR